MMSFQLGILVFNTSAPFNMCSANDCIKNPACGADLLVRALEVLRIVHEHLRGLLASSDFQYHNSQH